MSEDNGKVVDADPPQPQQGQVQLSIQVLPQGVMLNCSYPMQLGLPEETMDTITEQWIMQRPTLLLKIVRRAKEAQKQELALVQYINSHKND